MPLRQLTVQERILLYLSDYSRFSDDYEAPLEVTQAAIAHEVGIRVHHVTQYAKPLLASEVVLEKTGHIRGKARRGKAYFLTPKGRLQAASLRNSLLQESVPYRTRTGGVKEISLATAYQEERRGTSVLQLLSELKSTGYVSERAEAAAPGFVDFSQEAPVVKWFHGRADETAKVLDSIGRVPFVVVTGMAGVGKTTLGARTLDALRGERSLFWRRVRPWDTSVDLALRLGAFLKSHGRGALHTYVASPGAKELGRMEEALQSDLVGVRAVLVFDDVHNASEEAQRFFSILLGVLKDQQVTSALLLARSLPNLYSRREVTVEASVVELALKGLDEKSSGALLADAGVSDPYVGNLVKAAGGNPLFLKLLASSGLREGTGDALGTLETYIAEEIEPSLTEEERTSLQIASFYEVPVPSQALLLDKSSDVRTVVALQRKSLLEGSGSHITLHESLRRYFQSGLSSEQRETLVEKVVAWLMSEAEGSIQSGNVREAIPLLENSARIEVNPVRQVSNLRRLGDLRKLVGEYPASIDAYRRALAEVRGTDGRAALHARIALSLCEFQHFEEAEREIERGVRWLPPGPTPERAWLLYCRSRLASYKQDLTEAREAVEEALKWLPGLPEDLSLVGHLEAMRGLLYFFDPKPAEFANAQAALRASITAYEAAGDWNRGEEPYTYYAYAAFLTGQVEEGFAYIDRAVALIEKTGNEWERMQALSVKARYLSECLGEYGGAEALLQEAYRLAKLMYQNLRLPWFHRLFADLYRRQGRIEEARESLEYCVNLGKDTLTAKGQIDNLALLVHICIEVGDLGAAGKYLKEAQNLAATAPSDSATHSLEWANARLCWARGDTLGADLSFRRALAVEALGFRGRWIQEWLASDVSQGELLLDYGRFLASTGEKRRSEEVLHEAREELRRRALRPLEQLAIRAVRTLGS